MSCLPWGNFSAILSRMTLRNNDFQADRSRLGYHRRALLEVARKVAVLPGFFFQPWVDLSKALLSKVEARIAGEKLHMPTIRSIASLPFGTTPVHVEYPSSDDRLPTINVWLRASATWANQSWLLWKNRPSSAAGASSMSKLSNRPTWLVLASWTNHWLPCSPRCLSICQGGSSRTRQARYRSADRNSVLCPRHTSGSPQTLRGICQAFGQWPSCRFEGGAAVECLRAY